MILMCQYMFSYDILKHEFYLLCVLVIEIILVTKRRPGRNWMKTFYTYAHMNIYYFYSDII